MEHVMDQHPNWGIHYFAYDWFSAIRTSLVRQVCFPAYVRMPKMCFPAQSRGAPEKVGPSLLGPAQVQIELQKQRLAISDLTTALSQ